MKAVVQRVKSASVTVENEIVGQIDQGLLVLFGLCQSDEASQLPWLAEKLIHLRIFSDDVGKMNLSLQDIQGSILVVSQFTLYGDCLKGRRPSFIHAMHPDQAEPLFDQFACELEQKLGKKQVQTGQFGAEMQVNLINDGPATFVVDTPQTHKNEI